MEEFVRRLATGAGAGRPGTGSTPADTATPGTSAFDELAPTYTPDAREHAVGRPYPDSPGHFDDPNACAGS